MMNNSNALVWCAAIAVGVMLMLAGILYILFVRKRKEADYVKATVLEFLAAWILFLPDEFQNNVENRISSYTVVENILTALLRTFNIYGGEGYNKIECGMDTMFESIYAIVVVFTNLLMILFAAGFVLKLFEGPLQRLKLHLNRRAYIYLFTQCNAKTLSIAKSIYRKNAEKQNASQKKERCQILFVSSEISEEQREELRELDALVVNSSIGEYLSEFSRKAKGMEIFLFRDNEVDNLAELEQICGVLEAEATYPVRIYVELTQTPWSYYDEWMERFTNDQLVINFVRTEQNFAYNHLLRYSIFEHAISQSVRQINALIVGMNERNLELLKTILHLSQMPGYTLRVMVLDPKKGRDRLRAQMPEIVDQCNVIGDAVYELIYKEEVDLESCQVEQIISKEFPEFTYVFVNAGDDLLNTRLAANIHAIGIRAGRKGRYRLQLNLVHQQISRNWNDNLKRDMEIVGAVEEIYSHTFITMSEIERGSREFHKIRQQKKTKPQSWESYCNNEYKRHSVYARTLSLAYKVQLLDEMYPENDPKKYLVTSTDIEWMKYEHMRWNVYTRTLGYRIADSSLLVEKGGKKELEPDTRYQAMVHNDLVVYEKLDREEKKKDGLELTEDIVRVLKGVTGNVS